MFCTPLDQSVVRGAKSEVLRGSAAEAIDIWPYPALTIAFYRNPLDRALSAYEHFIKRTLVYPEESNGGPLSLGRQNFTDMGFTSDMEFKDFALHLRNVDLELDLHLKPQSNSFDETTTHSTRTATYQLEQLDELWPEIVNKHALDCSTEVVSFNAAQYETKDRLSGARLGIFEDMYQDDYERWEDSYHEPGTPL
jgi:hypothetical protein